MKPNACWAQPVNPACRDEMSNGSDENGQVNNCIKKTSRTNIIATNFVSAQLKTKNILISVLLRSFSISQFLH